MDDRGTNMDEKERTRATNPLYNGPVTIQDIDGMPTPRYDEKGTYLGTMTPAELDFYTWASTTLGTRSDDPVDKEEAERYDRILIAAQDKAKSEGIRQQYGKFYVTAMYRIEQTDKDGTTRIEIIGRPIRGVYYSVFYELDDAAAIDTALGNIRTEARYKQTLEAAYNTIQAEVHTDGSQYAVIPDRELKIGNLCDQIYDKYERLEPSSRPPMGRDPDYWIQNAVSRWFTAEAEPEVIAETCKKILDEELKASDDELKRSEDELSLADDWLRYEDEGFGPLMSKALSIAGPIRPDVSRLRIGVDVVRAWSASNPNRSAPKKISKRLEKEIQGLVAEVCKAYIIDNKKRLQTLTEYRKNTQSLPEISILTYTTDSFSMLRPETKGGKTYGWSTQTELDNYGDIRSLKLTGSTALYGEQWVAVGMRWDYGRMNVPNDDGIEVIIRPWRYAEVSLALFIYNKVKQAHDAGEIWYDAREYELLQEWKGTEKLRRDKKARARLFQMITTIARGEIDVDLEQICNAYKGAREELAKWGIDPTKDKPGNHTNIEKYRRNPVTTTKKGVESTTYIYSFGGPPLNILIGIIQGKYTKVPKERTGLIHIMPEELDAYPDLKRRADEGGLLDAEGGITIEPTEENMGMQYHVQAQLYLRRKYHGDEDPRIWLSDLYEHSFFEPPSYEKKTTLRKNVERYFIAMIVRGWIDETDYKPHTAKKTVDYYDLIASRGGSEK